MPILKNIDSSIDVDQVIRAQGADPSIIRERRKNLVDIAQQALEIGTPLLEPQVLYQEKSVQSVLHQKISFPNKQFLKGNKSICRMLGCSLNEITNLTIEDIHSQEDLDYLTKQYEKDGDLGYDPGPTDGLIGPRTREAIRRFQLSEGRRTTGMIDYELLRDLDTLRNESAPRR